MGVRSWTHAPTMSKRKRSSTIRLHKQIPLSVWTTHIAPFLYIPERKSLAKTCSFLFQHRFQLVKGAKHLCDSQTITKWYECMMNAIRHCRHHKIYTLLWRSSLYVTPDIIAICQYGVQNIHATTTSLVPFMELMVEAGFELPQTTHQFSIWKYKHVLLALLEASLAIDPCFRTSSKCKWLAQHVAHEFLVQSSFILPDDEDDFDRFMLIVQNPANRQVHWGCHAALHHFKCHCVHSQYIMKTLQDCVN